MNTIVGVNTYMELDEANILVENELLNTDEEYITWSGLAEDSRVKLLIRGTRVIDSIPFIGIKYNLGKPDSLQWPRIINNNVIECPVEIKLAILKQVLRDYSNKSNQETKLQELGVKSYSINKASISFSDKNTSKLDNGIYQDIYNELLRKWVL